MDFFYGKRHEGVSSNKGLHPCIQSASSVPSAIDDEGSNRPHGVRSAKARGKKPVGEGKDLSQFQTMWSIKMQDSVTKERLSKMMLLDSLIAKQDPLQNYEEALKKKLITELMSD
ncbi:hypothetical protein F2Q68_00042189 [Brassica cretica]|uniref:No apical meristem-associated C-terminal domain-containing protein n=1 Tax=Brassica cretica TaxID=69181 RepID=A0A8S9MH86_BRACR|nr:hypothetical protein F2Q68_00042189 [Brassica cretica]